MISHEYRSPIKERLRNLESRYIHEGRVVFDDFADLNYVRSLFHFLEFECLLEINDQICPRFILEFYSQYQINYSDEGQMFIEFVIQNQFFSYSLEEFAQILDIPCEGACVFTDKWSLDELAYGVPTDGPYQTNPPSPDDIISYIRIDREGQVTRIRHEQEIDVHDHQILTREIVPTLKPLEEIIWENVFCLGGNRDHVPACLCYMLYCVARSEKFNLAYYMAKRMEWVTKQSSKLPHDYSRKYQRAILEPWRQCHNLPPSPPPNRNTPVSPITTNSLPSLSPPQNPSPNQIAHELHHLSNLLEINLQQAIEVTNPSPPTSPCIPPPSLDQVNVHSKFCHCCMNTQNLLDTLKDDLNRLKSLIIGPSTQFPSLITTSSP
ncbi:hypothetical protein Tco_0673547 [Tanacetum coccineum]